MFLKFQTEIRNASYAMRVKGSAPFSSLLEHTAG